MQPFYRHTYQKNTFLPTATKQWVEKSFGNSTHFYIARSDYKFLIDNYKDIFALIPLKNTPHTQAEVLLLPSSGFRLRQS